MKKKLQQNLSWALTFDFLVHQEGGVAGSELKLSIVLTSNLTSYVGWAVNC